jgi:hypothetical protein
MEVTAMFGYKSTREQLLEERRKNADLRAQMAKANADIEYIAMMTDVEMEEDETEVQDDGSIE